VELGASVEDISKLNEEREAIASVYKHEKSIYRPAWIGPVVVVALALVLIGVGQFIHVPPQIALNASVSELTFTAANESAQFGSGEPIDVTELRIAGDQAAAKAVENSLSIQSLVVLPRTRVTLRQFKRCLSIVINPESEPAAEGKIGSQPSGGLEFIALPRIKSDGELPMGTALRVGPGAELYFCTSDVSNYVIAGPVSELNVSRVFREGTPRLLLSSVVSGNLRIAQTAREIALNDRDRLVFAGLVSGWLIVFPKEPLRIIFSARASHAEWVGVSAGDRENLAPTLVDIASASPWIKSLVGAFTGLIGLLWGALRYFSLP
jgi:hypothetical protein